MMLPTVFSTIYSEDLLSFKEAFLGILSVYQNIQEKNAQEVECLGQV